MATIVYVPAGGSHNQFDGLGWAAHFWSATAVGDQAQMPSLMNTLENAYVLNLNKTVRASVRYIRD